MIDLKVGVLIAFAIFCFSCEKTYEGPCDQVAEISESTLLTGPFSDETLITSATFQDGCLELTISYGGGCEENEFILVTDGILSYTGVPSMKMGLVHDDQDNCEAIITETVSYSLAEINSLQGQDSIQLVFTNPQFTFLIEGPF